MIYTSTGANVIDDWFISLTGKFDGFGMVLYVILTLFISAIISALIGLERYRKGENAGIRTHALLAISCSFLMTISIWAIDLAGTNGSYDVSRIAAGSVAGIGFLGTGVIIKDKFTVRGLSTATTLWICAAIGLAIGAGFVLEGVIAGCMTMLIVFIRNKVIVVIDENAPHVLIKAKAGFNVVEKIKQICDENLINLKYVDINDYENGYFTVIAYFPYKMNPNILEYFMVLMVQDENIIEVEKVMKHDNKNFHDTHES